MRFWVWGVALGLGCGFGFRMWFWVWGVVSGLGCGFGFFVAGFRRRVFPNIEVWALARLDK